MKLIIQLSLLQVLNPLLNNNKKTLGPIIQLFYEVDQVVLIFNHVKTRDRKLEPKQIQLK